MSHYADAMKWRSVWWITSVSLLIAGCATSPRTIGMSIKHEIQEDAITVGSEQLRCYRLGSARPPRGFVYYLQGSSYESGRRQVSNLRLFQAFGFESVVCDRRCVDVESDERAALLCSALEDRVEEARAVLEHYGAMKPLIVAGASEGGDVAARLALDHRVTHLILLSSGGGLTQADEFRILIQKRGQYLGMQSAEDLERTLEKIRTSPDESAVWAGHFYRRWKSFLFASPLPSLLSLTIPILSIQGEADENTPVESARAVARAFERNGKLNLTYIEVPSANHEFRNPTTNQSLLPRVCNGLAEWLVAQQLLTKKAANDALERLFRR